MHSEPATATSYRGRLALSPTGFLHLGHAHTFWIAQKRAESHAGTLFLRNEDLDQSRSKLGFLSAMFEDLHWFGFQWWEKPNHNNPYTPYSQNKRLEIYQTTFK